MARFAVRTGAGTVPDVVPPPAHLVARVAHQRDVAIGTRERLLAALPGAPGQVVLSTCHRIEVYEIGAEVEPIPGMRTLIDELAAVHLFRVAAGLDSAIAGEPQILRQVGAACDSAGGAMHPLLRRLFEQAVHVGREVRRSTRLGEVRRSVGSLAADEAVRSLRGRDATVLVIGAGEMGKLAVRALSRFATVLVANRDPDRAQAVAAANGAQALSIAEVPAALERADAVISAADTRGELLSRALLAPRAARRALVVIDIAVPRSVAEDARDLPGLAYRSVDDLADDDVAIPQSETALASERCAREAARFMKEWHERAATDAIRDVRANADSLRREQLDRALRRLGHLPERDRRIVEALSIGLTNSILHAPTVALREEPSRSETARELFGLDRDRR